MKHLELNAAQIAKFQKLVPVLHIYLEEYAQKELPKGKPRRTGIGNAVESAYCAVLESRYSRCQVDFEHCKTMFQMAHGPDGLPDSGYDIRLSGLTYEYRIDCKWQEYLKYDTVDMGLFYASGNPQFAMSGKATHSAHFYLEYKPVSPVVKKLLRQQNKSIPKEYKLKIVFVDLEEFRQFIVEVNSKYTAGPHTEHKGSWSNDRILNVPVKWLEENECAISYTIEA